MATWIMHLRVAERLKPFLGALDEEAYYVGSIAPDSGQMVDNFTYQPPKDVSHWKREGVSFEQRFRDNAEFFKKYGANERDLRKRSLFLGYYIHILTDTVYVREVIRPFIEKHGRPHWRANIEEIRAGWYELDFRFLVNNKGYYPLSVINAVKEFKNEFFDYFGKDDLTERMHFAAELYSNPKVNPSQRFLTVDEEGETRLIEIMTETILCELKKYNAI